MSENTVDVNVDGQTFEVTLDTTNIVIGGGGVTSWNGRTLTVVPEYGDYASSLIENDSGVSGLTLSDALDTINGQLLNPNNFVNQFTTGNQQVSGRLSIVTPLIGNVSDAVDVQFLLDNVVFNGDLPASLVESVYGRSGVVVAETGDYSSTQITNFSGVSGANVSDALDSINSQLVNPNNFVNQFTTDPQQVSGRLSIITPSLANVLDAVNVQFLEDNVVFNGDLNAINISTFINDVPYLTANDLPPSSVISVAGKTGIVILDKADISDFNDSDYATASQGALADSALQSGDNNSSLNNDSLFITLADLPNYPVLSVNGKFGNVVVTKEDVGLSLVDNTSDLNKPVSNPTQSALDDKVSVGSDISQLNNDSQYITLSQVPENVVTSVNTLIGDVVLDKTSVGLNNVDNTSDLNKPVSNATQSALDNKLESGDNISELNNDAGYVTSADLPSGGLNYIGTWDADQNIPDLANSSPQNGDFYEVSVSGNTPLGGVTDWSVKDWAIFSDTLGWDKLDNTSDVTSVNGRKGAIILDSSDVGLSNVDNTSDLDKPVSNAVQTELNTKLQFGDNVSELLNDSGYLSTISTDSTITGTGSILDPLSVNFPSSGVLSVTGDGVDNTIPSEPVISFPDLLEMQTIRPLRTIDGEAVDEVGGGDISVGVTALTGNAVDNTIPNIPQINFPNADQVEDSGTTNKFATATQLNQITQNTTDILDLQNDKGDMFKSVYDINGNGIVDKAQNVIYKAEMAQGVTKGTLLYAASRNPSTGDAILGVADNTVSFANRPVGIASADANVGDVIEVIKIGGLEDIDTSNFPVGTPLYLSTFGTFDSLANITTGVFSCIGYVALSGFSNGVIVVDTVSNDSSNSSNTLNDSTAVGRTVTDALDTISNKIDKPSGSSFELDIMRRSNTSGEFDYYTPVGGSVKINGMLQNVTVIQDGNVDIDFSGNTQSFSNTINQFPRNVANQFPSQDPVSDPNTFYPLIFNSTTGRWLENPVDGQIHFWRITARFTRSTTAGNRQMRFILTNPDTGFEQDYAQEIRRVNTEQTITANIVTVADSGSIGSGYILNIDLDNQGQTTGNTTFLSVDVTRLSLEKT